MAKSKNKILVGASQVLDYLECDHAWTDIKRDTEDGVTKTMATCSKCGVRVSEFLEEGQSTEIA